MMYGVIFWVILSLEARPVSALGADGKVILCVFVPIIVLVIAAIFFRFWWEWHRQDRQPRGIINDRYSDISLQGIGSTKPQPPKSRGKFVLQVYSATPSDPESHDTYRSFEFLQDIYGDSFSSHGSASSSSTFMADVSSPRSIPSSLFSDSLSSENSAQRWAVHSNWDSRKRFENFASVPRCRQGQREFAGVTKKKTYHDANHIYCFSHEAYPHRRRPSLTERKRNMKKWRQRRMAKNFATSDENLIPVRRLFPRVRQRKPYNALPTNRELQMQLALNERESYKSINALCAEIQQSFLNYHNLQAESGLAPASINAPVPLKSCLKCGSARNKTVKHVTFKVKSSVFKIRKRRTTRKANKIKATALKHKNSESGVNTWTPLKDSEARDGNELKLDMFSGNRGLCPSDVSYTISQKAEEPIVMPVFSKAVDFPKKMESSQRTSTLTMNMEHYSSYTTIYGEPSQMTFCGQDYLAVDNDICYSRYYLTEGFNDVESRSH